MRGSVVPVVRSGGGDGTSCGDTVCVNASVTMVVVVVVSGISLEVGVDADIAAVNVLGPVGCVIDCSLSRQGLALIALIARGLRGGEKW